MRDSDPAVSMQDGVDVTNFVSLLAAAGSNSSAQFTAAARSIIVAIAANRSADVASAVGAVVITADAANNTQASSAIMAQQGHAESLQGLHSAPEACTAHSLWIKLGLQIHLRGSVKQPACMRPATVLKDLTSPSLAEVQLYQGMLAIRHKFLPAAASKRVQ